MAITEYHVTFEKRQVSQKTSLLYKHFKMNHLLVAAVITTLSSGAVLRQVGRNWIPNSGPGGAENVSPPCML